jgi:hypothetical protein
MRNICIIELVSFDGYLCFKNQKLVFALAVSKTSTAIRATAEPHPFGWPISGSDNFYMI